MKSYVKPCYTIIQLRVEEGIACYGSGQIVKDGGKGKKDGKGPGGKGHGSGKGNGGGWMFPWFW